MTIDDWCRKAIGVPFVPHGRDYEGWDCWGLVVCAYRDVRGVDLPDVANYSITDYRALSHHFGARSESRWWRLDKPEPMAIAGIYRRGHVIHAGLVIHGRRIVHVEQGVETCVELISNFRVEGYYVPTDSGAAPV